MSEGDLLKDQRGSPAYISPDVLSGMFKVPGRGPEPHTARFCSHSYKQDLNQTVSVGGPGPGAGVSVVAQTSAVPPGTKSGVLCQKKLVIITNSL